MTQPAAGAPLGVQQNQSVSPASESGDLPKAPPPRLQNFPVSWFATVMGLSGFSIAWNRGEYFFNPGFCLSSALLSLTTIIFFVLLLLYGIKLIKYPAAVKAEWQHPVKQAFVPAISIAFILMSVAYLPMNKGFSFWLWALGTVLHFSLTMYILSSWIHHEKYEIVHLNPAWFIPVVGNILIPIAGVAHAPIELSWFFFSFGLFFWPILTAIIFYRLIFHKALPEKLMPTLFIFIAPPAVGVISWFHLHGEIDSFGRILYALALAFFVLLLSQINRFRRLPFFLSWWAYSFPLAALTIASLLMAKTLGGAIYIYLGGGLLVLLSLLILLLLILTVRAVMRHEICLAEH